MTSCLERNNSISICSSSFLKGLLAGVKRDPITGKVKSASAFLNTWLLKHDGVKAEGRKPVDEISLELEMDFLDFVVKDRIPEGLPKGAKLLGLAERR